MKTYYLVAETQYDGKIKVFVSDNTNWRDVLMEIEAESFIDAVKKISFSAHGINNDSYCGVDANGNAYAGKC